MGSKAEMLSHCKRAGGRCRYRFCSRDMGCKDECQTAAAGPTQPEPFFTETQVELAATELVGVDAETAPASAAPGIKDAQEGGEDMEEEKPEHDPCLAGTGISTDIPDVE